MGGVRWFLVGSLVLVWLAGCGRVFMFEEREPWRHDAEVACLKSGAVKEGAHVVRIAQIEGPGICGADFPLKVAAIGGTTVFSFDDLPMRPPGSIPGAKPPPWPISPPRTIPATPQPPYAAPPQAVYAPPPAPYAQPPRLGGSPLQLGPPIDQTQNDRAPVAPPVTAFPMPSLPLGPRMPLYTGTVEVKPAATLACPIVSVLDQWLARAVQPAAQRWFGQPVVEIRQISSYSCRSMNNQAGARISEHAFGNALDVAAFVFADGRVVKVKDGWRGLPEEQGFLRDVQGSACDQFNTVLAPGADAFHYDHIHIDLMRRASARRICQPAAVDGESVAALARQRNPAYRNQPQQSRPSLLPPLPPQPRTAPIDPRNDPYEWRGSGLKSDDAIVTGSTRAKSPDIDHDSH